MPIEPTEDGRFIIASNRDKSVPLGIVTRDVDNQDLIELIIAYGVEPVFSEGDDEGIWVHFLPNEIQSFEDVYFSNKSMMLTTIQIAYAKQWWRDIIRAWRSKKRHNVKSIRVNVNK